MTQHPNVVHADDLPWEESSHGERFAIRRKRLSHATGGVKLGCSLYRVPPGKTAFPFHAHHANEEAIYILQGEGTMRMGDARVPVRAGDYVAFPVGEPHQLLNTSGADLVYLCLSTMTYPEVAEYPDSGKLGIFGAPTPGQDPRARFRALFRKGDGVDYYEGE